MTDEENDLDWNDYAGPKRYGSIGEQEDNDFNDIKIKLDVNKQKSEGFKYSEFDLENNKDDGKIKLGELRKSSATDVSENKTNKLSEQHHEQLQKQANRCCNCLHTDYYQKFFDVTTQDVLQRLFCSLIPFKSKLAEAIGENYDIYGPFWIYATMIYLLGFAENMHNYLLFGWDDFTYDFQSIATAFSVVYGIGFGVPLAISCLIKCYSETELKFVEVACVYGYSFTSLCIAVMLCAIPVSIFKWVIISIALTVNISVIINNFRQKLSQYSGKAKWTVILTICFLQISLMIAFNMMFLKTMKKE